MKRGPRNFIVLMVVLAATAGLGWMIYDRLQAASAPAKRGAGPAATPVEAAEIVQGPMEWRRTFSGTLESPSKLVVAPKISGRIEKLTIDLGDPVERGQVVAWLDDDEYVQAVNLSKAELEVAKANRVEAESALEIAARRLKRMEQLRQRNVASDAEFDTSTAEHLGKLAQLEVSRAELRKAEAALKTAEIRLGYTRVAASWSNGGGHRVVGDRYVDEGETVSANDPLISVVQLDPILGVIFVTEKDYVQLKPGRDAFLTMDAFPGEAFAAHIHRISPVFRQNTRQAKVELKVENAKHRLKPGMFIRATIVLDRLENATIVPRQALTKRNDRDGIFVVNPDGQTVGWREVTVGIHDGDRVQVEGQGLSGRVVTLGQQLVDDGSQIAIPDEKRPHPVVKSEASAR